jgi:hypothetical protein
MLKNKISEEKGGNNLLPKASMKKYYFPTSLVKIKDSPQVTSPKVKPPTKYQENQGITSTKLDSQSSSKYNPKESDEIKENRKYNTATSSFQRFLAPTVKSPGNKVDSNIIESFSESKFFRTEESDTKFSRGAWIEEQKKMLRETKGSFDKNSDLFNGDRNFTGGSSMFEPDWNTKFNVRQIQVRLNCFKKLNFLVIT